MENIQLFLDEINEACDDGKHWVKATIETLRTGEPHMTEEEIVKLDDELGKADVRVALEDLYTFYDGGEPRWKIAPIIHAAYEWVVGPFIVTHKLYDPYWYRSAQ